MPTVTKTNIFSATAIIIITMLLPAVLGGETVIFNGKPFFPVGVYHYPGGLPLEPRLEELSRAGFNTVLSGLTTSNEFMDSAHRLGIGVIAKLGGNMLLEPEGDQSKMDYLRRNIERLKDHPALLGYEAPDEIAWADYNRDPGRNLQKILRGYEFVRSIDPSTPVWMNHAPRNSIDYLKSYSQAGDILGTDIYPVPEGKGHSDLDPSLNCVGQYTDKLEEVAEGRPIYMVLQGFGWEDLHRGSIARQPNWVETRFMAYDAICHGANGIIYWGMSHTMVGDPIWQHLKRAASEIRDLTPVLLNGSRWPAELDEDLESHLWMYDNYHYLIVLNTVDDPLSNRTIELPGSWTGGEAYVLFEDRSIEVQDGVFQDTFVPYGVHIYTDDPRPDLDIDCLNPEFLVRGRSARLPVNASNRGGRPAGPFNISLWSGGGILSWREVEVLPSSDSKLVELEWTPLQTGVFNYSLVIDRENSIEERTETNNEQVISMVVAHAGPDLRINSVSMESREKICAEVQNNGVEKSGSFNLSCVMGGESLAEVRVSGLHPGGNRTACLTVDTDRTGELTFTFIADSGDEIPEMLEDNNEFSQEVILEDLVKLGPALHVRGLAEDNLWLIKYNSTRGALDCANQDCKLVWGMDDWAFPEACPRRSRERDGLCESPMLRGIDGLWYTVIPNQRGRELLFKFRDGEGNIDDHGGGGWRIVRTSYVLELLEEYERLVSEGEDIGVDMSEFQANFSAAWNFFRSGNYTAALDIAESYEEAGVAFVKGLLELARDDLAWARSQGIEVKSEERKLVMAERVVEAGKYVQAERYCQQVMEHIPEVFIQSLLTLLIPFFRLFRRKGTSDR